MIPDLDLARVRRWVDGRNGELPTHLREKLRFEIDLTDRAITVYESRLSNPADDQWDKVAVCRFRYTMTKREWALYWQDGRNRFHLYDQVDPTPHIEALIEEVRVDPTGIFWG
ncbi:MAG: DUF3024 domain-containing protein [Acidimicrobiales bacterium]